MSELKEKGRTVLHQLLAVEPGITATLKALVTETHKKFTSGKSLFTGSIRTLKMLADSSENNVLERQETKVVPMGSTVADTLKYTLDHFARSLDLKHNIAATNQVAKADLILNNVVFTDVPVDMLLHLEAQLAYIRSLFVAIPTTPATAKVTEIESGNFTSWKGQETVTAKTAKVTDFVIAAPATDKHPAQIRDVTADKVVGHFTDSVQYGTASTYQMARLMSMVDNMMIAVKDARMRANSTEVVRTDSIGNHITGMFMSVFDQP